MATHIRWHHKDGRVITETLLHAARENGVPLPRFKEMVAQWVADGDLRRRPDGGYDVIHFRPRLKQKESHG